METSQLESTIQGPLKFPNSDKLAPAVVDYINNYDDPLLPQLLARDFVLPVMEHHPIDYLNDEPLRTVETSMVSARSESGDSDSVARLTDTSNSVAPDSLASSSGKRDIDSRLKLLVSDGGDCLVPMAHPVLRNLAYNPLILQCPFDSLSCHLTFEISEVSDWFEHSLNHFVIHGEGPRTVDPSTSSSCCFCEMNFYEADGSRSWDTRMRHVAWHHHAGHTLSHARPDYQFFEYLWQHALISQADYHELKGPKPQDQPKPLEKSLDETRISNK